MSDGEAALNVLIVVPYVPSLIRVRPYNFIKALARRHDVAVLAVSMGRESRNAHTLREMCSTVDIVPFRTAVGLRECTWAVLRGEPMQAAICQSPELGQRLDR